MRYCSEHAKYEEKTLAMQQRLTTVHSALSDFIDSHGESHGFDFAEWDTEPRCVISTSYGVIEILEYLEEANKCVVCTLLNLNVSQNRAALLGLYVAEIDVELWAASRVDHAMKNEGNWVRHNVLKE